MKPFFSIVIPTLNEANYLPLLLNDLAEQIGHDFEVIHIDADSVDQTQALAGQFKKRVNLTTRVIKRRNVGRQRNYGAKLAGGKWILFMDADIRIPKNFLKKLKRNLVRSAETDLFSCLTLDHHCPNKRAQVILKTFNLALKASESLSPQAPGSLLGIRRELMKKFSFDEQMFHAEDRRLVSQVAKAGYHYQLFNQPRYQYSLRRFEKEGYARLSLKCLTNTVRFFLGAEFKTNPDYYPMKGGRYYQ